ncbi:protein MpLOX7 [Marchantia polymorpha subsp. ruderalis]|uniref:Lipoxygenase domain-containing protein n=2 Tax=Marchantia polymorpha TaxID=3197 RepID=A0A176W6R5_MARPO|nr:hypothetical protein AXG93_312s1140 [Marchantia polymorpha subsp. ruderalis]PTQ43284.1 hypothetical protein MARPO_0026s0145 [Marchantia polymorpha]BBN02036.1 hypothetical protein Mp_2g12250 [Marchantia polymorpha subsp. ruderalis]|eukprot:PTQ43284.1 hypothetical protein MARPO_0026s0145 [Marchantia polymorpha]
MEGSLERSRDDLTIVAQVNVNLMKVSLAGLTNPAHISIQLVSQTPNADSPAPAFIQKEPSKSAEVTLVNPPPANGTASQAAKLDNQFPVVVPSFLLRFTQLTDDFQVGAIIVRNNNKEEFYLNSVKLKRTKNIHDVPKDSDDWDWVFECDSQVHPTVDPQKDFRVFFPDRAVYFPGTLTKLKEHELDRMRGDVTHLQDDMVVYDYDVYNDLGFDFNLGGSQFPYPRRLKKPSLFEPSSGESTTGHGNTVFQTFIHTAIEKVTDANFVGSKLVDPKKTFSSILEVAAMDNRFVHQTEALGVLDLLLELFDMATFNKNPRIVLLQKFIHVLKEVLQAFDFPKPRSVITLEPKVVSTWSDVLMNDDEFGRQALAGMNPTVIQLLKTFPSSETGKKTTDLQDAVEQYLSSTGGLTLEQAIEANKLFIIDYHDAFKAYVGEINKVSGRKTYAGRAIFLANDQGKLSPVAIELSLPKDRRDQNCTLHRVFTPGVAQQELQPSSKGKGGSSDPADEPLLNPWWELAKIHFISLDFAYHELVSHWLQSHAVMEPIIIATKRTLLSKVHPIGNLLEPTFKNTLDINFDARQILINKIGIISDNFTAGEYSMKISSGAYKAWRFDKQGAPADLVARGMATIPDPNNKDDVVLVVKDYPYAQDALDMWKVIKAWVRDYVQIFYKSSADVLNDPQNDGALQNWWTELRTRGHPDIKEGWPELDSVDSLVEILTTIFWIAGPHHAAVNFGQYDYAGYVIQRSSMTRQLIPEFNVKKTQDAWRSYILDTIATPRQTFQVIAILKVLSTHVEEEQYLGEDEWTINAHGKNKGLIQDIGEGIEDVIDSIKNIFWHKPAGASQAADAEKDLQKKFKKFSDSVSALEKTIEHRNKAARSLPWSNRIGYSKLEYTLLLPQSKAGMTGMGVPYSTSI